MNQQRAGGRGRLRQDLTTGSVPKKLFFQAWPQTAESIMLIADQVIDLILAGRLPGGFRSVAGIGVAQTVTQVAQTARGGLDQSSRAIISRAIGSKNFDLANSVMIHAFLLNSVYSVVLIVTGVLLADAFLQILGTSAALSAETADYLKIRFGTAAMIGFRGSGASALQATGDVITPLRASTLARVVHMCLSPLLMFGLWIFPNMGIAGASLAGLLGEATGGCLVYYSLLKGTSTLHLHFKGFRFDRGINWQLIKIGAPASIVGMERAFTQLILLRFVTPFGDIPTAAFAITKRLENFLSFGSMGVGNATGVMVGQSLGAENVDRAKKAIWWGVLYGNVVPAAVRVFIIISPVSLVLLFSSEPAVVATTSQWLQAQVYASMLLGTAMVFQQSYNTAGDTMFPLLLTAATEWLIEIPMAYLLSQTSVGPIAVVYAAIAAGGARVLGYSGYFFTGRWDRVKVLPNHSRVEAAPQSPGR